MQNFLRSVLGQRDTTTGSDTGVSGQTKSGQDWRSQFGNVFGQQYGGSNTSGQETTGTGRTGTQRNLGFNGIQYYDPRAIQQIQNRFNTRADLAGQRANLWFGGPSYQTTQAYTPAPPPAAAGGSQPQARVGGGVNPWQIPSPAYQPPASPQLPNLGQQPLPNQQGPPWAPYPNYGGMTPQTPGAPPTGGPPTPPMPDWGAPAWPTTTGGGTGGTPPPAGGGGGGAPAPKPIPDLPPEAPDGTPTTPGGDQSLMQANQSSITPEYQASVERRGQGLGQGAEAPLGSAAPTQEEIANIQQMLGQSRGGVQAGYDQYQPATMNDPTGGYYGAVQGLMNSQGYDPQVIEAMRQNAAGAAHSAADSERQRMLLESARTGQSGGMYGASANLGAQVAGQLGQQERNFAIQNAQEAQRQRELGLGMAERGYNAELGSQAGAEAGLGDLARLTSGTTTDTTTTNDEVLNQIRNMLQGTQTGSVSSEQNSQTMTALSNELMNAYQRNDMQRVSEIQRQMQEEQRRQSLGTNSNIGQTNAEQSALGNLLGQNGLGTALGNLLTSLLGGGSRGTTGGGGGGAGGGSGGGGGGILGDLWNKLFPGQPIPGQGEAGPAINWDDLVNNFPPDYLGGDITYPGEGDYGPYSGGYGWGEDPTGGTGGWDFTDWTDPNTPFYDWGTGNPGWYGEFPTEGDFSPYDPYWNDFGLE